MAQGKLIVISSPSGGGKSTIIEQILKKDPSLGYSVSATTRHPRQGEKDGIDYFFWDKDQFIENIDEGAFLEWKEVHGHYYGTLKEQVKKQIDEGRPVLLDVDVQGGIDLKQKQPEAMLIFILPPSLDVLKDRLIKRGTESGDDLKLRLSNAEKELSMADYYDFQVINLTLEKTVQEVLAIIHNQ